MAISSNKISSKNLNCENVVLYTADFPSLSGAVRYREAKIAQLHKRWRTQIDQNENHDDNSDDLRTVLTILTPSSSVGLSRATSMSTISTTSSSVSLARNRMPRQPDKVTTSIAGSDWGFFVDAVVGPAPRPPLKKRRSFLRREIEASKKKEGKKNNTACS